MINIVYAFDENYVLPFSISVYSLLKNATTPETIHVFALCYNIDDTSIMDNIKNIFDDFGSKLTIINVDIENLKSLKILKECKRLNKTVYIRLYIADLIPDIDRCIYIDCDTLVLGDISELWNIDLNQHILGSVYEEGMSKHGVNTFGFKEYDSFNSGVLLLNLDKYRKYDILNKLLDIHEKYYDKIIYADQDILNILFHDNRLNLPQKWNQYNVWWNTDVLRTQYLLHYIIPEKPWNNLDSDVAIIYREYYFDYLNRVRLISF